MVTKTTASSIDTNNSNPEGRIIQQIGDGRRVDQKTFAESMGAIFGRTPAENVEAIIMWAVTFLMFYVSYHLHAAYYSGNPDALGEFFKRIGLA